MRWADAHPEAPWIVGAGWADGAIADERLDATWLASLGVGRPIFLRSRAWHSALVDPIAMGLAGITDGTPDPPDGRLIRDARHLPTGILHESAVDLVAEADPRGGPRRLGGGGGTATQALFHGVGIAAWQDAAVYPATLAAYRDLDASGRLTMRTSAALLWDRHRGVEQLDELDDARRATPGRLLRVDTVKIMLDGIVESGTAALERPYEATARADRPHGDLLLEPPQLLEAIRALEGSGWSVHIHAVGDRAVRAALDAFEGIGARRRPRRRLIAHIELLRAADAIRFVRLGVTAVVQPVWSSPDGPLGGPIVRSALGTRRSRRTFPLGQLERAGAALAFGSDWRVSTQDPLRDSRRRRAMPGTR